MAGAEVFRQRDRLYQRFTNEVPAGPFGISDNMLIRSPIQQDADIFSGKMKSVAAAFSARIAFASKQRKITGCMNNLEKWNIDETRLDH